MTTQFRMQLQQQQQAPAPAPVAPVITAPHDSAAVTNSAIAEFLADASNTADDAGAKADAENSPALAQVPDDAEGADHPDTEKPAEKKADDAEVAELVAEVASQYDGAKLVAALEKKDLSALLEAMGPAAEELLTSKAHVALRLQERDAKRATEKATKQEQRAVELTAKLEAKYGDPVAVRKLAAEGTPEAAEKAVEMVEKWAGTDWNTFIAWVSKSIVGKPTKLEAKPKPEAAKPAVDPVAQAKALEETRAWVTGEVKKADAALLEAFPEAVGMVIDEIRGGLAKGIDSPAKAMPAVITKLKAQHEALSKYFTPKPATKKAPAPIAKVGTGEGKASREPTLEELIAETVAEAGGQVANRGAR